MIDESELEKVLSEESLVEIDIDPAYLNNTEKPETDLQQDQTNQVSQCEVLIEHPKNEERCKTVIDRQ